MARATSGGSSRRQLEPRAGVYPLETGQLELLPDADIDGRWLLRVDGTPQSFLDLEDPTHLEFDYVRQLAAAVDALAPPGPLRALHLGGGGATLPRFLAATRPGSRQIVVELDAALAALLRGPLRLPRAPEIRLRVADARAGLADVRADWAELVVADVFAGGSTPAHLTSREFFLDVTRVMTPGGLLLVNLADGRGLQFARAEVATLLDVFGHVVVAAAPGVLASRRFGNLVVAASTDPLDDEAVAAGLASEPAQVRVLAGDAVTRFAGGAKPITDETAVASPPIPP